MNYRFNVLSLLFFLCTLPLFSINNTLIVNEIQPSNATTYADEDGKHEDWIELYNASTVTVSLEGWSLTDNVLQPRKWTMAGGTLAPGAYLVVFASDKDRRTPGTELHTNFKLSATGDYLALYNPSGEKVMEFNQMPRVEQDFSYCYINGFWMDNAVPTPGRVNSLDGVFRNPDPKFSMEHGLFSQAFNLTIQSGLPNTDIYYTLDGSTPSATNGTLYVQSLLINRTSVVRAIALSKQSVEIPLVDSRITTKSYLFPEDIIHQTNTPEGYPAKWGKYATLPDTAVADYEMDPELIADVAFANKVIASFSDLPIISLVTDKDNFFKKENNPVTGGIYIYTEPNYNASVPLPWERPVSMEYIDAASQSSLQVDCGVQLHGGASRWPEKCPKHSLRIDFRDEYGVGKLRFPLIGAEGPKELNSFFLRAGFSDTWNHWSTGEQSHATFVRDTWAKLTQLRMNNQSTHITYAHLFINGMYWGLYNPIERIDDDFCETWFGGNKVDWDVIKDGAVSQGSSRAWKALRDSVNKIDADNVYNTAMYMKIQGLNMDGTPDTLNPPLMDVDNFIDYLLINYHGANTDWDSHNWAVARNRVDPGLGFRFLCWDSENVIDGVTANIITGNRGQITAMFQKLRTVPLFCVRFADRAHKHLFNNGWLTAKNAAQTFIDLTNQIESSLWAESARWGDYRRDVHPYSSQGKLYVPDDQFNTERTNLLTNYFPRRTDEFIKDLREVTPVLYPTIDAATYKINGSLVVSDTINYGDVLSINGTGMIYYTMDNTDPVSWAMDGSPSQKTEAILYTNTIPLQQNSTVKSRAYYQGIWSALNVQDFVVRNPMGVKDVSIGMSAECYPNPFKTTTTFNYTIPSEAKVHLSIYDMSGRVVATVVNANDRAGAHQVEFDGSALNAGVYICRFTIVGTQTQTKVLRIIKL